MRKIFSRTAIVLLFLFLTCSFVSAQNSKSAPLSAVAAGTIVIENEDGKQTTLNKSDIAKIKRLSVEGNDHGNVSVFEGVPLVEVLKLAKIEFGEALRGQRLATFLLVEAADNYRAVFALPELDPAFTDKIILLADRRDGKPLSEKEGAWRVVVPDEKRQGRWVRQVTRLKILRAPFAGK